MLVGAALFAGCSSDSSDDETERAKPIEGVAKQVAAAVGRLDEAARGRRFEEICDELFTRAARARAGGGDCAVLLSSATEDVKRPRVRVLSINVEGRRAQARVRTRSAGERTVDETIALERERGRYRIASLSR